MDITKSALREAILPSDAEILIPIWRKVGSLIEKNIFSSRMTFLLNNQNLAEKEVKGVLIENSKPNCIGTALFVAGVGKIKYPYHAFSSELRPYFNQGKESKRWDDVFRTHLERRVPGAFVFSYSLQGDGWHAGIYIGEIQGEHLAFAQHGHGEMFGPEIISKNYSDPDYYIPSTLSVQQVES